MQFNDKTLIVTADAGRMRAFKAATTPHGTKLQQVDEIEHADSRKPGRELVTDRPGRAYDHGGSQTQRSAMEPKADPQTQEANIFAKEIAEWLAEVQKSNKYDRLVLAAAPHFLGILRPLLTADVQKAIELELDKDYVTLHPDELWQRLDPWKIPSAQS